MKYALRLASLRNAIGSCSFRTFGIGYVFLPCDGTTQASILYCSSNLHLKPDSYRRERLNTIWLFGQVYRGPDSHKGYEHGGHDDHGYGHDDGYFAPSGYYVYQPEDDKGYGYH